MDSSEEYLTRSLQLIRLVQLKLWICIQQELLEIKFVYRRLCVNSPTNVRAPQGFVVVSVVIGCSV